MKKVSDSVATVNKGNVAYVDFGRRSARVDYDDGKSTAFVPVQVVNDHKHGRSYAKYISGLVLMAAGWPGDFMLTKLSQFSAGWFSRFESAVNGFVDRYVVSERSAVTIDFKSGRSVKTITSVPFWFLPLGHLLCFLFFPGYFIKGFYYFVVGMHCILFSGDAKGELGRMARGEELDCVKRYIAEHGEEPPMDVFFD